MYNYTAKDIKVVSQIASHILHLATINVGNLESGFLTGNQINDIAKDDAMNYAQNAQNILVQVVDQIDRTANGQEIPDDETSPLSQYIFDRFVEIAYKVISDPDGEVDTRIHVPEAFGYYEIDIPEYLQLKLTNVVKNIAIIYRKVMQYITDNGFKKEPVPVWMYGLFFGFASVALRFVLEMDFDDTSEMDRYLYED